MSVLLCTWPLVAGLACTAGEWQMAGGAGQTLRAWAVAGAGGFHGERVSSRRDSICGAGGFVDHFTLDPDRRVGCPQGGRFVSITGDDEPDHVWTLLFTSPAGQQAFRRHLGVCSLRTSES